MNYVVKIPNVERDERIGSAFNHLFQVISQTDDCASDKIQWDLQDACFYHPFYLAPLVIYKQMCKKCVLCMNKPERITGYLDLVCFESPMLVGSDSSLKEILNPYISKTFLPVCQFDLNQNNIDELQSLLQKVIRKQSNADSNITTPLSYFLGELIDNMNEHSKGTHGYIFSQYLRKERCIDLVLADDGISIFGSYVNSGKYMDEIEGNEAEALRLANEGKSTKNLPNAENRGYGISSSKEMLVKGLGGSFFMLSGGAFHRYDSDGSSYVELPDKIYWNGTIILMRIPVNVPKGFDYSKYTR